MKNKFFFTNVCLLILLSVLTLSACVPLEDDEIYVATNSNASSSTSNNSGIIESDYSCTKPEKISGIVTGNVTISDNATLTLSGVVAGNVTVNKNSRLVCSGVVNGNIIGQGSIELSGVVNGTVADTLKGVIHKGAYVNGVEYTENVTIK